MLEEQTETHLGAHQAAEERGHRRATWRERKGRRRRRKSRRRKGARGCCLDRGATSGTKGREGDERAGRVFAGDESSHGRGGGGQGEGHVLIRLFFCERASKRSQKKPGRKSKKERRRKKKSPLPLLTFAASRKEKKLFFSFVSLFSFFLSLLPAHPLKAMALALRATSAIGARPASASRRAAAPRSLGSALPIRSARRTSSSSSSSRAAIAAPPTNAPNHSVDFVSSFLWSFFPAI